MANQPEVEPVADTPKDEGDRIAAFDLDGDDEVSLNEENRATLGVLDAQLEHAAQMCGINGKLAGAFHRILDRLDND